MIAIFKQTSGGGPLTQALGPILEIPLLRKNNHATSAYLFFAGALAFFIAAIIDKQSAFFGPGALFIAVGAAQYRKSKMDD